MILQVLHTSPQISRLYTFQAWNLPDLKIWEYGSNFTAFKKPFVKYFVHQLLF